MQRFRPLRLAEVLHRETDVAQGQRQGLVVAQRAPERGYLFAERERVRVVLPRERD